VFLHDRQPPVKITKAMADDFLMKKSQNYRTLWAVWGDFATCFNRTL